MISFSTILLRLGVALVLGAVVGFERESREHAAGMRTVALVALGSCLFTLVSAFGFLEFLNTPHIQVDPTRIASYVVAGIGFLGAGSIFLSREQERVKGLTTAATIWLIAAIGMACGAGLLLVAVVGTLLALFVLITLRFVERILLARQSTTLQYLHIETVSLGSQLIGQVYETLTQAGITVETLEIRTEEEKKTLTVLCRMAETTTVAQISSELQALPEVRAVQVNLHEQPRTG
jgi:putative Mg2+ transporter-C (MgtC) family protein